MCRWCCAYGIEKKFKQVDGVEKVDIDIRTVTLVEQQIVPMIGDLVPVSGKRSQEYNAISGGAKKSKHLNFCALDLVPEKAMTRNQLHQALKAIHRKVGKQSNMELGLYSGLRFHIDTCGYRSWEYLANNQNSGKRSISEFQK